MARKFVIGIESKSKQTEEKIIHWNEILLWLRGVRYLIQEFL